MTTPVIVDEIFKSKTISASGNATYNVNLRRMNAEGFFSIQIEVTGDGTVKVEYLESNNGGTDFIDPEDDIVTGFTSSSGPDSDGKDLFSFEPNLCGMVQIKITETGGADPVVVNAWLAVQ